MIDTAVIPWSSPQPEDKNGVNPSMGSDPEMDQVGDLRSDISPVESTQANNGLSIFSRKMDFTINVLMRFRYGDGKKRDNHQPTI